MTEFLIGIDVGTTSTKAVLIDSDGRILADAQRPCTLSSLHPGWAEEDPEVWWHNLTTIIPECLEKSGVRAENVSAIGCSGMVPTLILLDQEGKVLRDSIQQNDARAVEEIELQHKQTEEADILRRTGSAITQQSIGPKLLWLSQHEPEVMRKARHLMGSYDFIVHRLTGALSIERNWALESGLYDLYVHDWDDALLKIAGISRSWLGEVHLPADVVGKVTAEAARQTGLKPGTPVVAGSADHIASAFSAGLKDYGDLLVKLGGSGDILFCVDQVDVDPRLFLDYHVIPDKFLVNGCMAASGSLIRWFRDQFSPGIDFSELDQQAMMIPAGSDGLVLLPYFLGEKTPIQDPLARGTLIGLTLSHTKAHIYRSILEGIAYGFQHHLLVLAEHKHIPKRARLTNGGAHSLLWRQITSDVIGLQLEQIAQHPGSSLGAAFVAGKGTGVFQDWSEIERYIKVSTTTKPDMANHKHYQSLFKVYRETYNALKGLYPLLTPEKI